MKNDAESVLLIYAYASMVAIIGGVIILIFAFCSAYVKCKTGHGIFGETVEITYTHNCRV